MDLIVYPSGTADWNGRRYRCALGTAGISQKISEGDGVTPAGRFSLRHVYFRADRLDRPDTILPVSEITNLDGWSDDPNDPSYNQKITLPSKAHHEKLWRTDSLYDLVAVVGYNDRPVIAGAGSAVFLHIAKPGYAPTEGCVAFDLADLSQILSEWTNAGLLCVQA